MSLICSLPIAGCNQPKSLSGIETIRTNIFADEISAVAINLNPYQGLKRELTAIKVFKCSFELQST